MKKCVLIIDDRVFASILCENEEIATIELYDLASRQNEIVKQYHDEHAKLIDDTRFQPRNHRLYFEALQRWEQWRKDHPEPQSEIVYQGHTIDVHDIIHEEFSVVTLDDFWNQYASPLLIDQSHKGTASHIISSTI